MNIKDEAVRVINNTKCAVCGNLIELEKVDGINITFNHNSLLPNCSEYNRELISAYRATIDGTISIEKLKSVAGKPQ